MQFLLAVGCTMRKATEGQNIVLLLLVILSFKYEPLYCGKKQYITSQHVTAQFWIIQDKNCPYSISWIFKYSDM